MPIDLHAPQGRRTIGPSTAGLRPRLPDLALVGRVLLHHRLALIFLAVDLWYVFPSLKALSAFHPGSNATLYADAARAWLIGADPWQVIEGGIRFAGPPPTLLIFVPFAFLPSVIVAVFWFIADVGALAFVVRRLQIAWWWVLFPPIMEGLLDASPEPVVLACLVAGSPLIQGVAPILKIYAAAPLVGERDWRAIGIAVLVVAITALVLPWRQFIDDWPMVSATLANGTANLSAFSVPWLIPVGLIGLAALGFRRAGWLAVPVLWPHTQLHYATMTLPAMTPLLAVGFSLPIPGAPAVAVAAQALLERWQAGRSTARTRPSGQDLAPREAQKTPSPP